jgi:outer membrane protein assembly factor BamB
MLDSERLLRPFDRKTVLFLAVASGVFSTLMISGLAWNALAYRPVKYFDEKSFLAMKEAFKQSPGNDALKEEIRQEDLARRKHYYRSRGKLSRGAWLLFGGLLVFALSLRRLAALSEQLPQPLPTGYLKEDPMERRHAFVSVLAVSLPIALATLVAFIIVPVFQTKAETASVLLPAFMANVPEAIQVPNDQKWPEFRGPGGVGTCEAANLPLAWDAAKEENILWKVPVPLAGNSSPIVWGDHLFLTGADMTARKVFCLNRLDGSLLWTCEIHTEVVLGKELEKEGDTGLAAPTPVTDGRRIYAFFGTNELAAVDFTGKQIWGRWFGPPKSDFGVASSPRCHNGLVILQLDQGTSEERKSFLYGINGSTGKTVWQTPRNVSNSWSTPIVAHTGQREEIIASAEPWVMAYDPKNGREWWRAKVLKGAVAPLPVFCNGFAYTVTENSQLSAIQTGGEGDITGTHVKWTYTEDLPDVSSPVTDGKCLLLPTANGKVTCLDAKTGKILWTKNFKRGFWSSPTLVGENVYLTDNKGKTVIFKLAETYQAVGEGNLGEPVITSPAISDSKIYLRGEKNLYCIGQKS